jgi:diacylglycerol kinase
VTIPKINRLQSFQYAFSGIWYTFRTQRNAQIHVSIAVFIVVLGLLLKLNLTEWAILTLTTGFVFSMELLNTATESAMDYVATEFHPQIKVVKDVAAGGVLVAAITAVIVGALILGPRLIAWLF